MTSFKNFTLVPGIVLDQEAGKANCFPNPGVDKLYTFWFGSNGANPPNEGTAGLVMLPMLDTTVTLNTGGLTTTVASFFPAGFRLLAGSYFIPVGVTGGGVSQLTLGDGTVANRFGTLSAIAASNGGPINSGAAWDNPANASNAGPFLAAATNLVITANAQNTAGSIHVVFWGIQVGTLMS